MLQADSLKKEQFDKLIDIIGKLTAIGDTEVLQETKEDIEFEIKQTKLKLERLSKSWYYKIVDKVSTEIQGEHGPYPNAQMKSWSALGSFTETDKLVCFFSRDKETWKKLSEV